MAISFGKRVSWDMVLVKMMHFQSCILHDNFSQSMRGAWEVFCFITVITLSRPFRHITKNNGLYSITGFLT